MVIVLELENIGGFIGKHRFEFKEGLNEVLAPNASGKTSLIKAILAMYAPSHVQPSQLLNIDAESGYIKIIVNGSEFIREFKREDNNVIEVKSRPIIAGDELKYFVLDPYLGEVVRRVVTDANADLTDYLVKVFKLNEYERNIENLRHEIDSLKTKEEHLSHEVEKIKAKDKVRKDLEKEREILIRELERVKAIAVEKVKEIQDRIAILSRKLGEIETRIKDIRESLIPTLEERRKAISSEIKKLEDIVKKFYNLYKEPNKEIEKIKARIGKIEEYITTLMREREVYLKELDARLSVIGLAAKTKLPKCPICGQPIMRPEKFWSERERLVEEEVKRVKEEIIRDYDMRIEKANNELKSLWKKLEELQRKYNEVRELESMKIPSLKQELNKLGEQIRKYEKELRELENKKDVIQKQLKELKTRLSKEELEAAEEREKIERKLGEIEQRIKDLEEELSKSSKVGEELARVRRLLKEKQELLNKIEKEFYEVLTGISNEFSKLSSEVIKELGFTWLRAIRLYREGKRFTIRVIRIFPSGREYEQPLDTLSTSERMAVALIATLVGYKKRVIEDYKGLVPILADEGLLAFDPARYECVLRELSKYGKYIIVTKLTEPSKVSKLTVVHRQLT